MMAYIPVAQNTPWQQTDEFDISKTAVLVIDVLGGEGGATPGLEDMASNSVKIVKAARAKGLPVVFSCDAHIPGLDKELGFGVSMALLAAMLHSLWLILTCRKAIS